MSKVVQKCPQTRLKPSADAGFLFQQCPLEHLGSNEPRQYTPSCVGYFLLLPGSVTQRTPSTIKIRKHMRNKMLWILAGTSILGAVLWGPIVSNVEQAKYTVAENHGSIEIREYASMIVAETEVSGDRETAISQGFRTIADYIFGNNISTKKVAMTAPVTQQQNSEKIAMTAPVTQTTDGKSWVVRFVMPISYTMQTLPIPSNTAVKLKEVSKRRYAVIRFSGMAGSETLKEQTLELESFISTNNLKAKSEPTYAFFNPPWTLPFMRRNEVMIEI
jgi:effector-binding domain-containing protein